MFSCIYPSILAYDPNTSTLIIPSLLFVGVLICLWVSLDSSFLPSSCLNSKVFLSSTSFMNYLSDCSSQDRRLLPSDPDSLNIPHLYVSSSVLQAEAVSSSF